MKLDANQFLATYKVKQLVGLFEKITMEYLWKSRFPCSII